MSSSEVWLGICKNTSQGKTAPVRGPTKHSLLLLQDKAVQWLASLSPFPCGELWVEGVHDVYELLGVGALLEDGQEAECSLGQQADGHHEHVPNSGCFDNEDADRPERMYEKSSNIPGILLTEHTATLALACHGS